LAESHTTDATIAMTYGLLAAHSLGLGASAIDLVPAPINRVKELRQMLNIPEDHEVVACMILGYPRYKYQRAIKRKLAGISWV
ncbi:MAG: nitroreductase family protein, partial [Candidatus Saccharibacteria bacterium]